MAHNRFWFFLCTLLFVALMSCEDPPFRGYSGFTRPQVERLLTADTAKAWALTRRLVDNEEITLSPCQLDTRLIFSSPGPLPGNQRPLFLAYNPLACPLPQLCNEFSTTCQAHNILCAQDSSFCAALNQSAILFSGTWQVQDPFIINGPAENLQINRPADTLVMRIERISSLEVRLRYNRANQNYMDVYVIPEN
ncbi:MAG: hypothetical protein JJU28_19355 [Cyclobacteriaceae bacterium]|nr:hypothetical protein [Cyclobacteriaceae bacterium]